MSLNLGRSGLRLDISGLRLERGGRVVVAGLDAAIGPGRVVALTGPSGSGKSSVLLALAGLLTPTAGAIRFAAAPARGSIAMIFQEQHLVARASVLDNACCGALHRLPWWSSWLGFPRRVRNDAHTELSALGIAHLAPRWTVAISGGERARTAVARAMVQAAPLVLADEPVAALDAANAEQVMLRLRRHADAGNIVICALHQPELVARYADHTIALPGAESCGPDSPGGP